MDDFSNLIKIEFDEDISAMCLVDTGDGPCGLDAGHDDGHASTSIDEPPVGNPYIEDPAIIAFQQDLVSILKDIETWAPQTAELANEMKAVKSEQDVYLAEVRQQMAAYKSRMRAIEADKKGIEASIAAAENKKAKVLADIDHHLEAIKAKELLQAVRSRWREIIAQHDWLWNKVAREYQRIGIEFIASGVDRDLGGIALLDQMGLGKTLQARGAIDLIQNHPEFSALLKSRLNDWDETCSWSSAVLWVCPDSIKEATAKELGKWSDAPVMVLEGTPGIRRHIVELAHRAGMTLIVGYAQTRDRGDGPVTPELFEHDWPIVVMDEIHMAKNRERSTFFNTKKLVERSAFCIPMTGTPIDNKAEEFWTILHLLTQKGKRSGEFQSFPQFERRYLTSWDGMFQYGQFDDLMESVSDMMVRRRKDEVLEDLPDKIRLVHFVQMTGKQLDVYNQMRERLIVWLDEQEGKYIGATNFLAKLTYLRQIAMYPGGVRVKGAEGEADLFFDCEESAKLDRAMLLIREYMASDEKVLIFANFNLPLHRIEKLIADEGLTWTDRDGRIRDVKTAAITGKTKRSDRLPIQEAFNDPDSDVRVVVGNIKAMGLGLNLQEACSNEIFLDLYWNPGANDQAEDRCHRLGQKASVTVNIIQAENSVDAFIAQILEKKLGISNDMVERDSLRKALDEGLI